MDVSGKYKNEQGQMTVNFSPSNRIVEASRSSSTSSKLNIGQSRQSLVDSDLQKKKMSQ